MIARSWDGLRTTHIAAEVRCHPATVREKITRFNAAGLEGLGDRPGGGRKPRLSEAEPSAVIALLVREPTPGNRRRSVRHAPGPGRLATTWLHADDRAVWEQQYGPSISSTRITSRVAGPPHNSVSSSREALLAQAKDAIPVPDTGSVRADLVQLLQEVIAFLHTPLAITMVQLSLTLPPAPAFTQARRRFWQERFALLTSIVDRAAARGEVSARLDPHLVLEALIGPIYVRLLLTGEPLEQPDIEQLVDLVLHGMQANTSR